MPTAASFSHASIMGFVRSYRNRNLRYPLNQEMVRSTTQRTFPRWLPCGAPRFRISGLMPIQLSRDRVASLSYPASAITTSGNSLGRPGLPLMCGNPTINGISSFWSLRLEPAVLTASGTPFRSTIKVCLVPGFARSTGLGPVNSPAQNARVCVESTIATSVFR